MVKYTVKRILFKVACYIVLSLLVILGTYFILQLNSEFLYIMWVIAALIIGVIVSVAIDEVADSLF